MPGSSRILSAVREVFFQAVCEYRLPHFHSLVILEAKLACRLTCLSVNARLTSEADGWRLVGHTTFYEVELGEGESRTLLQTLSRQSPTLRKVEQIAHFKPKRLGDAFNSSWPWPSSSQFQGSDPTRAETYLRRIVFSAPSGEVSQLSNSRSKLSLQFGHSLSFKTLAIN